MELATAPRKMPTAVARNRYTMPPAMNSGTDPTTAIPSRMRTITDSANAAER